MAAYFGHLQESVKAGTMRNKKGATGTVIFKPEQLSK